MNENDKLGVGFIGVGGRGRSHLFTVQKMIEGGEAARIVAEIDLAAAEGRIR